MYVKNNENNRQIRNVASSLAIENMYLSENFIKQLIEVGEGEKTSEELRQEVIKEYVR